MGGVILQHDAIFHVLLGGDTELILGALRRSAQRLAEEMRSTTAHALVARAGACTAAAQAVFIVFLHLDAELRAEVLEGTALALRARPLDEHKATRLFAALYESVLAGWLKTELNTPLDLVSAFRQEYLVS